MPKPVIKLEPALEDPDGTETVISVRSDTDDPSAYCGGIFRFRDVDRGNLTTEIYPMDLASGKKLGIYAPRELLLTDGPVEALPVPVSGGFQLIVNDHLVGFIDYDLPTSNIFTIVERTLAAVDIPLLWTEDVDGEAEALARYAGGYGIPEEEVLQQALDRGRLGRKRTAKVKRLERLMYRLVVPAPEIGARLKQAREGAGMSAKEVAAYTGLEPERVLAFEAGSIMIFAEDLVLLADALGVIDPEELLATAA